MWSDQYYYLNIVHNLQLTSGCSTQAISEFLGKQPELIQVSDFRFQNSPEFRVFIDLQLLNAYNYYSWSDSHVNHEFTNMLAIVCTKSDTEKYELVKGVLVRVAAFLNWQLIDEETDDDIENYVIWKPA